VLARSAATQLKLLQIDISAPSGTDLEREMAKGKKLQFVWPKDGPKGRSGHRGFFGRLDNILTGRGPDVFLQRGGSREAIRPDLWGNW
jgi:hypothetical protein